MGKHTLEELKERQALPLDLKIRLTMTRIRAWVNEYGESGVYISFSGGKDSTVLLDIVRNKMGYKDIPAVFVDVPTQYPELKEFVQTFENVEIIKPKISFVQVCEKYGFPLISKEVSESVQGARKYLTQLKAEIESVQTDRQTDRRHRYSYFYERVTGTGKYSKFSETPSIDEIAIKQGSRGGYDNKYRKLRGIGEYAKRPLNQQKRREQSTSGNNVGLVHEQKDDSGKYP